MIIGKTTDKHIQDKYEKMANASLSFAISAIKKSQLAPYISALYLYGSTARRERSFSSDIDLFAEISHEVISDFGKDKFHRSILMLKGAISPDDIDLPEVDFHYVIGSDWRNDETSIYYKNIRKDGVNIWE